LTQPLFCRFVLTQHRIGSNVVIGAEPVGQPLPDNITTAVRLAPR